MSHTPGPWKFNGSHSVYAAYSLVAQVGSAADARLVTAAPEMLEALQATLQDQASLPQSHRNAALCERIAAVIARATQG